MSNEFTSDVRKQTAAAALDAEFGRSPKLMSQASFDLNAGSGFVVAWEAGEGKLSIQVSYQLDLGKGEDDQATKALALDTAPRALMRVMVVCTREHPAYKDIKFAAATKSPIVLEPVMRALCQVARLSVSDETRDIMFPADDVQEVTYVGDAEEVDPNRIALGFYIVVSVTNSALIALKNNAATFLKSYLHIAAAHRIGPMASTLQKYQLPKG